MKLFSSDRLRPVFIMQAIDALAFSISGIFIPIFLIENGNSFRDVMVFFIMHNIILVTASFGAGFLAGRRDLKFVLSLRYPFLFGYLLMMIYWKEIDVNYFWLALLSGLQSAFFWTSLNLLFAKHADVNKMGAEYSRLTAFSQIAGLAGPMIGGIITMAFGFKALFWGTFVISLFSYVPLALAKDLRLDFQFKPKNGFNYFRRHPRLIISEIMDNIGGEMEGIIWPIFVYLTVKEFVTVGAVGTIAAIGTILFTLIIGKLSDRHDPRKFIRIAVPLLILNWGLRYFIHSHFFIFASTMLSSILLTLLIIPYTRLTFNTAKRDANDDFYIVKEVPTLVGRLIIFSLAILFADHISLLFPVAGIAYLYFLFL